MTLELSKSKKTSTLFFFLFFFLRGWEGGGRTILMNLCLKQMVLLKKNQDVFLNVEAIVFNFWLVFLLFGNI